MTTIEVTQFLESVTGWAVTNQNVILALALVGSHARNAATEASDVDLVLIATDPTQYLEDTGWVRLFGRVEKQQVEDYGILTSLRVWYRDGLEVEYGLTDERWSAIPLDAGTRKVMAGGIRVLFERGDLLSRHLRIP